MKERIGVIFGGRSVEHEISIISAIQVMQTLKKADYEVVPIYLSLEGNWLTGKKLTHLEHFKPLSGIEGEPVWLDLYRGKFYRKTWYGLRTLSVDLLFPIIHGTGGEDGTLQGLLELINLPYIGCDVMVSALGMDKILTKRVVRDLGFPVLDFYWFTLSRWIEEKGKLLSNIEHAIGFPMVVKPAVLGSSIGISVAKNLSELEDGIDLALSLSEKVLVERQIQDLREFNCAVLGGEGKFLVSECEEPLRVDEILSYQDKYLQKGGKLGEKGGGMEGSIRRLPADIPEELRRQIQDYAQKIFCGIGGHGMVRIDFFWDEKQRELYLGELNTLPGSCAFYLWEASGIARTKLVERLVELAKQRFVRRNSLNTHYSSNIFG